MLDTRDQRTAVVLVTGVDPDPLTSATLALLLDLPDAVSVSHSIDVEAGVLLRVVSDRSGLLEREEVPLAHACVSCALREDVVPTLDRLEQIGRWRTIVAQLPVAASAEQVCRVLDGTGDTGPSDLSSRLRVSAVVAALDGPDLADDLLGDALLVERGLHTADDDRRGVGEVGAALVEHADVVVVTEGADGPGSTPGALDLVRTLARPGAHVVHGTEHLEGAVAVSDRHHHARTLAWSEPVRPPGSPGPLPVSEHVWTLDLGTSRPFSPDRLLARIGELGGGRHRSRGCFWLPTRPDDVLVWDGAGGQLSVGTRNTWGRRAPFTRITLTGLGAVPVHLRTSFAELLHGDDEPVGRHLVDGFEPWLGPIRAVA